jgi:hypothetical protein
MTAPLRSRLRLDDNGFKQLQSRDRKGAEAQAAGFPPQTTSMLFLKFTGELDVGRTPTSAPDLPVRLGSRNSGRTQGRRERRPRSRGTAPRRGH